MVVLTLHDHPRRCLSLRHIEHFVGEREEIVDELRVTLLHEFGHYLGMDEAELEALGLE